MENKDMDFNEMNKRIEDAAIKLEEIENPQEFSLAHPLEWYSLVQQVVQNYSYIQKNADPNDFVIIDSMANVIEIAQVNPKLKGMVETILANAKRRSFGSNRAVFAKQKEGEKNNDRMNPSELASRINAVIDEIRNARGYDTDTVEHYRDLLDAYRIQLSNQEDDFSLPEYQSLLSSLDSELSKIYRFCQLMDSELMSDFKM